MPRRRSSRRRSRGFGAGAPLGPPAVREDALWRPAIEGPGGRPPRPLWEWAIIVAGVGAAGYFAYRRWVMMKAQPALLLLPPPPPGTVVGVAPPPAPSIVGTAEDLALQAATFAKQSWFTPSRASYTSGGPGATPPSFARGEPSPYDESYPDEDVYYNTTDV
jgi:hypothetical protein